MTDAPRIIGLDLSLTSTGIATAESGGAFVRRVQPKGKTGHDRLEYLRHQVMMDAFPADLVVIEGPSYASAARSKYAHEAAGLWWLVAHSLWADRRRVAIVPPASRAKYATGKGNAAKDAVLLAAARRYPHVDIDGNDQADALILAAMGADHLGHPLAPVPATHRAALAAVDWPDVSHG
jgi:crossover junction endodeoxyribonuclease RuvC